MVLYPLADSADVNLNNFVVRYYLHVTMFPDKSGCKILDA